MARHLVRSFVLTSVLSSLARAGPCRPSTTSVVAVTTTTTTTNSEAVDTTMSPSTAISVPLTTETSGAEYTGTTDITVAVETSIETSTVTDSQTQAVSTTAASDTAATTTTEATTTTAVPAPTCVNNLKNPTPEGASCGLTGNPRNSVSYVANGPVGSTYDCYEYCLTEPSCQSFAVQENSFCELYSEAIGGTGGQFTIYEWYDKSCFCDTEGT